MIHGIFDPEKDFRNIPYEADGYEITLISENITYDKPGKYETVYRVDKSSEEYWFVVRPFWWKILLNLSLSQNPKQKL